MGTKMHCKSYIPGFYSMRDLNDDSSTSGWPLYYGDKMVANGQYYNGFMPRTSENGYSGPEKDTLKQKMLEHEAVFKNQVLELHRLYRIQRDMMEEFKGKEPYKDRASMEPASSSSLPGPQVPSEEARKWHMAGFPLSNSNNGRTSVAGVENFSSPSKGNSTQPGRLPFQNGCTTKNSEVLDSRPLKVRKKFDLQLPADEYVDLEEEDLQGYRKSDVPSYSRNDDPNNVHEGVMKLFLGSRMGGKTDGLVNASASDTRLRGSVGLADLNEPIHIEEATAPSSIDFLGRTSENGEIRTIHHHSKSTASYLSVAAEPMHVCDGISINSTIESLVNDRGWLSHANITGSSKGNLTSVMQGCQPDKLSPLSSSHLGQGTNNQVHHPLGTCSSGFNREGKWREGLQHGLEFSDKCYSHSNYSQLDRAPGSYPFFSSSSFASSWFQSVSSWGHPSSSSAPKITTLETRGSPVEAISRPLQSSAPCQQFQSSAPCQQSFGENWHVDNSSSKSNRGLGSELKSNGFVHAPASGTKGLGFQPPSAGFNYLNCSRGNNIASDHSTNLGFADLQKGLSQADSRPAIDINLNEEALPKMANENVILQDLNMADGKSIPKDNLAALPWLRPKPKPVHVDEVMDTMRSQLSREISNRHASSNELCSKNGTVGDLNQLLSASCDYATLRDKETARTQGVKKILGFPIFERDVCENELSSPASASVNADCFPEGRTTPSDERKKRIIDINIACEPDEQMVAEKPTTEIATPKKDHIDLNSCVSDSEDPSPPFYERNVASVDINLDIDLEVPVPLESEDDSSESKQEVLNELSLQSLENQNKEIQDEVLIDAAGTLVDISSCLQVNTEESGCLPLEASLGGALLWLADAISSDANEVANSSGKERDDFEDTALQLVETKAEDYMPEPFVPELRNVEEVGARPIQTRTRRGHARRGRQWRDFQRDILPGLASLSRHEVTEDIQIFGGMMRATGHTWNSGLARRNGTRNGGGRGRRRALVETVPPAIASPVCTPPLTHQLSSIEVGLDDRSLTGWGKTTRRPRRQRCPAGNPPTVVLT